MGKRSKIYSFSKILNPSKAMSKLYVFAIGGSGSRVLRSLTMLFASGVKTGYDIVPMIIDPDSSNGDLVRSVDQIRQYQTIHDFLSFNNNEKNDFFKNSISALNTDGNYLLPLIGTSGVSFENYLNIGTMSKENQALMRMLFSNANLASDMNVGFKGNPNIGSIVLNQFSESSSFETFATNFVNGDKVFIISSIFGGTGASGFPLLLKNMRTNTNTALSNASIGAVSLLPYFNLKTNNDSSIQADSFITKTKAALNYYEKNVSGNGTLDDMYYLGDDFTAAGYENCDGGEEQQNNAHLVEMLAALSIIDFANKEDQIGYTKNTCFHEFGLDNTPQQSVVFADFGQITINEIRKPLSMMTIMNSYLNNRDVSHRNSQKWAKDNNQTLNDKFWRSNEYVNYDKFKQCFEEWLKEMANNNISFEPFRLDNATSDVLDIIVGISPQYGSMSFLSKKGCDLIDKKLSDNISKISGNMKPLQTFLELFYTTIKEISEDKLKL